MGQNQPPKVTYDVRIGTVRSQGGLVAPTFSEQKIQALFGHEAAEDEAPERLREYYFKSTVYEQVITDLPLRVLVGHKGMGKSALFQIAIAEDREANRLTLVVQPDDVIGIATDTSDFLQTIRAWKIGLQDLLATKAINGLGWKGTDEWRERLRGAGGKLIDFLRRSLSSPEQYFDLTPAKQLLADSFLRSSEIYVYIDDLDRGWQGRAQDITRISALLNAVRDIANENRGIRFRISLRSDVYFLVRTSDESTDKIEGSVVWLSWTNHEIFALLVKRINSYLGAGADRPTENLLYYSQPRLAKFLTPFFEPNFRGKGLWSNAPTYRVLLSLIRSRPRDLIKLCTLAARDARSRGSNIIHTTNLENAFEDYSQGRIQDTVNEFRAELPDVERLLFGMKPSKRERTAKQGYVYDTGQLLQKIKNIQEQGQFRFKAGRIADPKDLAGFLYKINFLTARRESGDLIYRKYFEQSRYLQSRFADFGFDWEVHPAYRWALQPEDVDSIYISLRLSTDDSGSGSRQM
ncbi:P-loop ATPase, Sll1717 family [Micromonospora sp. IBHARD004]|uniref:P-loop ATPase, Sll1717 family n=1 Tax=Micromonospora sp. IBHARD004 TaxID=3457764 RepID=UPI0040591E2F